MSEGDGGSPWWQGRADYWKVTLQAVVIPFAILPTIVFLLRLYASHVIRRHSIKADEIIMGLAVIFMWVETAAVLLKCYNGVGTPQEELPHDKFVRLNMGSWLVAKFCVFSLLCSRVAIILFLKRVFDTENVTRRILKGLIVYNVVWALVSIFLSTFSCKPVSFYWDKTTPGGYCIDTKIYNAESVAMSVLGLVADLAILAVPLPTVWRLQIKKKRKAAVTAVLCVGLIVCIFSLLRCVQFAYFDTAHLSTSGNLETLWTLIESDLSITCGCMPQLRPLFSRFLGDSTAASDSVTHPYYKNSNSLHIGYGKNNLLQKGNGVHTTIASRSAQRDGDQKENRESDEIELRGIHVQTTVNYQSKHQPTTEGYDRDGSSVNLSS